ncbi:hypothetical protein PPL_11292 [Heterostelium album PN500]|uniref:J domain-containing protein n=1 Tax=Heterostelium pallidum (strain ATCC 26659 / Pp 5 / PN500) TaxID=670386 RepID=D3BU31_HETP5|nr:hypothetical protein PPL_11292 [Heterostelium album PN500]EFA75217.1 hypothetical protein PPL_11292 [Heterostelium album PN500]|eukprot:XP_020427351.1 hypothetical protein PPL_11292 [Heterostelium album PN500]
MTCYKSNQNDSSSSSKHEPYNPYSVLGLTTGATEDEIKKAYRTLSRQHHPDKGGDEKIFIAISKAYESLTDPAIREKFEKYGNPDGPQPVSVGIALPSWLVNRNNSSIVALVILIPTGVYFWNKKSKQPANTVQNNSLALYYHVIDDKTRMTQLVEIIGASQEYKDALPERTSDEESLKALTKAIPDAHKIKKFRFNHPYIIKATTLLYAHISRIHQQIPAKLEEDLQEVLKKVRMLINGAFQICKEKRQLNSIIELLKLNQCVTQAAWEDQSLKQIPYLDSFNISSLNYRKVFDIVKFNRIGEEARKEYLQAQSIPNEKIRDIENVLQKIPTEVGINIKLVSGEEDGTIYSTAICTLVAEFVDKTPKKNKKSENNGAEQQQQQQQLSEENKQIEKELTAKPKKQKGMASKKGQKAKEREERRQQQLQKEREAKEKKEEKEKKRLAKQTERELKKKEAADNGTELEDEDELDDLSESDDDDEMLSSGSDSESDSDSDWEAPVKKTTKPSENFYHAPFVNEERPICWWVVFGDRLKNELVAIGKSESWEAGNTIKMQFLTPEKPGTYNYSLHLMCDGYIGLDSQYSINFKVVQNPNPIQLPPRPQHQQPQQPPTKKELKEQKKQKKLQ